MKPATPVAMQQLIDQIRETLPFDTPAGYVCADTCNGCSMKLLAYLDTELDDWEQRLLQGETPGLRDLSRLIKLSRKVHRVLQNNGVLA